MPGRPHGNDGYEKLLRSLERQQWKVVHSKSGHYKVYCPCDEEHRKTLPATPSSSRSLIKIITQLKNYTCWEKDL